jgi:hypothetical protein
MQSSSPHRTCSILLLRLVHFQIRQHQGSKHLRIKARRTLGLRMPQVHGRGNLEPKVKGDHANEKARETFNNFKKGKDNPIGQPFHVGIITTGFKGLEGHVGRIDESSQVDKEFSTRKQGQHEREHQTNCAKEIRLGVASLVFQCLELICFFFEIIIINKNSVSKKRTEKGIETAA